MEKKTITPIQNCTLMLEEVDSMLKLITSRSTTQPLKFTPKELPPDFSSALKSLKYRVRNNKNVAISYNTSRLKFTSPTALGPGQYYSSQFALSHKNPTKITIESIENTPSKASRSKSSSKVLKHKLQKLPKDHNSKVDELLMKRREVFNMNNLRKRDRFKTQMKTTLADDKKNFNQEVMKLFVPIALIYGVNLVVFQFIKQKKVNFKADYQEKLFVLFKSFVLLLQSHGEVKTDFEKNPESYSK